MLTNNQFTEQQKFRQIWLWVLLLGMNIVFIFGIYKQLFKGEPFGDNPASNGVLLGLTAMIAGISIIFYFLRLDTIINQEGIFYRFYPFQQNFKKISWADISKVYIRQYHPVGEYGGWGFRLGLFSQGRALNVSGNKGLQLIFTSGKKLLIGTQKPDEINEVLKLVSYGF